MASGLREGKGFATGSAQMARRGADTSL